MPKRIFITIALAGIASFACEKEPDNGVAEPEQREVAAVEPQPTGQPMTGEPRAEQPQAGERQADERQADEQLQTLPAVTIIGIELECPAADVYFPTDSAALDDQDKAVLDQLAACLKGTPMQEKVEITATADPRGPEPYNEQLSRQRAEAVANYLREQGVKEGSFEIRARGEQGVLEGIPALWPWQREAVAQPLPPATR